MEQSELMTMLAIVIIANAISLIGNWKKNTDLMDKLEGAWTMIGMALSAAGTLYFVGNVISAL